MAIAFSDVEPLLMEYHEKKIGEIIHHPEADPAIKYAKLIGKDIAGGNDKIVVKVVDDGTSVQSPDYLLSEGSLAAYKFEITPNTINWRATVTQEAIDAAGDSTEGLYNVLKDSTTRQIRMTMDKFAQHMLSIHGCLGVITVKAGQVLTIGGAVSGVADPGLMNRFPKGRRLVAADAIASGDQRGTNVAGSGDVVVVASTNDNNAEVTVTGDLTNFAVGDFLFERGDRYYAASTGRRAIAGVPEWFAATLATSQTLFGLDRSTSTSLQASRLDCDGLDLKVALRRARSLVRQKLLTSLDTIWLASAQYQELETQVEASAIVDINLTAKGEGGRTLTLGLQAIKISNGNGGWINCVEMPRQESGVFYGFNNAQNPFVIGYTDQMVRTHNVGGMWRAVEGGVLDATTSEYKPAYRCEGSLRACLYSSNAGAGAAVVGYNFFGA